VRRATGPASFCRATGADAVDATRDHPGGDGALAALLQRLGADGEPGGEVYERLRLRLVAFLRLHVRAEAESLADVALDRLARRVQEGTVIDSVPSYVLGIARLLVREEQARRARERRALEGLGHETNLVAQGAADDAPDGVAFATPAGSDGPVDAADSVVDAVALAALQACLEGLDDAARRFVLEYYLADGPARIPARQRLAAALGLSLNAVRNRALRLRARLESCVAAQLGRDAARVTKPRRAPLEASSRGNRKT
jgi:DNA-directed RNA polymerase specialized sigma24 family protein